MTMRMIHRAYLGGCFKRCMVSARRTYWNHLVCFQERLVISLSLPICFLFT